MAYGTFVIEGRRFVRMICGECGVEHYFPEALDQRNHDLGPKGGWTCPNGHQRIYSESASDKLRRERDQLAQRIAQKDDDIRYWQEASNRKDRKLAAAKGQITKIKNRATKGLCPCCNRHFTNLERHMGTKHPGFIAEPSADEHVN